MNRIHCACGAATQLTYCHVLVNACDLIVQLHGLGRVKQGASSRTLDAIRRLEFGEKAGKNTRSKSFSAD